MFALLIDGKYIKTESFTDTEGLPVPFYGRIRWENLLSHPTKNQKLYKRLPPPLKCLVNLLDQLEKVEPLRAYPTAIVVSAKLERERDEVAFKAKRPERIGPSEGFIFTHNGVNLVIAQHIGLETYKGMGIDHVCSSGLDVLGIAAGMIDSGRVKVAVVATINSMASASRTAYHRNLKVVSRSGKIRPFDKNRDGTIFSDGLAVALLCSEDVAVREHLEPLACITGYGSISDGYHMFSMPESGRGFRKSIEEAVASKRVDLIKAHATGTPLNDRIEGRVYVELFPHHPPVTALKPLTGHSVTSSGLLETLLLIESLKKGTIPHIKDLEEPDPACGNLNLVRRKITWKGGNVLSVAAGFGGFFSSLFMEVY